MRLVRGPNLKELIARGELDARAASCASCTPVADALDTAHEAGLIHRDIKPQNILVGSRDHAYLADFGLTQALGEPGLTRTGQFVGTLDYIAPEQIHGEPRDAPQRRLLVRRGAVRVPDRQRALRARVRGRDPVRPRVRAAAARERAAPRRTARALDEVLDRAMAKDPEQRMDSATRGDGRAGRRDRRRAARTSAARPAAGPPHPPARRGPQAAQRASTTDRHAVRRPRAGKTIIDRPPSAEPGRPAARGQEALPQADPDQLAVILVVARRERAGSCCSRAGRPHRGPAGAHELHQGRGRHPRHARERQQTGQRKELAEAETPAGAA